MYLILFIIPLAQANKQTLSSQNQQEFADHTTLKLELETLP